MVKLCQLPSSRLNPMKSHDNPIRILSSHHHPTIFVGEQLPLPMAVAAVARPAGAPAGVGPDQSAAASHDRPRPPGMNQGNPDD